MASIKVLLADDHSLFREGLRKVIENEPGIVVIEEVDNGTDVVPRSLACIPDVVSLDLNMPGTNGIRIIEQLRSQLPQVAVLVVTMHDDPAYAEAALAAGCQGYLLKTTSARQYAEAVRVLASDGHYVSPEIQPLGKNCSVPKNNPSTPSPPQKLSERESEILALLAQGYTYKEISEKLHLSIKTIETYRTRLGKKLGIQTRAALVKYYQEVCAPNSFPDLHPES